MTSRSKPNAQPAARRQAVLHGREQAAFFGQQILVVGKTLAVRFPVSLAQHDRVKQLVIAIGQLDALEIELEAFGDCRRARANSCQRRLTGGVVVQDRGLRLTQVRCNLRGEVIVEDQIAVGIVWQAGRNRRFRSGLERVKPT